MLQPVAGSSSVMLTGLYPGKNNRRHTCLRSGCDNCKPDNRYPINKHFIPLTHADITLPAVTSLRNSLS
ncbi:hypothetical protein KKS20_p00375 (plasmid) [Escherichia coli]|uniref:Uncharacterized protein n=1 Tax=Escherichia coli TaxID=562 RepID=A0A9Q9P2Y6_ECOLX|nr:hypothetical protein KKS20_p00375 [Escherichia coli]